MKNNIITPIEEKVLTLYTEGKSKEDIAIILNLPIQEVRKIFNRPNIKKQIKELIEYKTLMLKDKHLSILDRITDEMLKDSENIKDLLRDNRDILDVIDITNKVTKDQEREQLKNQQTNVFVQILNQLSEDIEDTEIADE